MESSLPLKEGTKVNEAEEKKEVTSFYSPQTQCPGVISIEPEKIVSARFEYRRSERKRSAARIFQNDEEEEVKRRCNSTRVAVKVVINKDSSLASISKPKIGTPSSHPSLFLYFRHFLSSLINPLH